MFQTRLLAGCFAVLMIFSLGCSDGGSQPLELEEDQIAEYERMLEQGGGEQANEDVER